MKDIIRLSFLSLLGLASCAKEHLYNESASLADSTKISGVLEGKVITSMVDKKEKTMSTLYGNDIAAEHARSAKDEKYPAGSELSLVTWSQKDDIHWYGANIPGEIKSVEIVKYVSADSIILESYEGKPLQLKKTDIESADKKIGYITGQRAAVLP
ncbi:cytochrome P460 family protein [Dyadobacter sp. CY356]|uniref:cytochrome P460 family protein n=1 Tax=Dyadobacter sp. CY356 TaxID=2906442 RepID=UPI001F16E68C|nr:cytochrome P460 family protein [Dyadobacter sp. CY356]MCF0058560.1 cytochrome P460 family protein [Dyadobacter sp. CY356]